jgi:hypothetical protein
MATKGEKIRGLRDFFADAFRASESNMVLTLRGYEDVARAVNPSVGGIEYFFNVAQELAYRNQIDDAFFVMLRLERPRREEDIRDLQEFWLVAEKATPTPSGGETSSGPPNTIHAEAPATQPARSVTPSEMSVFISYARPNRDHLDELYAAYAALKSATPGLPTLKFIDDLGEQTLGKWRQNLKSRMLDSDYVVLVLSPEYLESENCRAELNTLKDEGFPSDRIAPILARQCEYQSHPILKNLHVISDGGNPVAEANMALDVPWKRAIATLIANVRKKGPRSEPEVNPPVPPEPRGPNLAGVTED